MQVPCKGGLDSRAALGAFDAAMGRAARLLRKAALGAALALAGGARAQDANPPTTELEKAGWTLVTASEDVYVYMRPAEPGETGLRRVWTAYDSASPRVRDGFTFRSVRSLGEYDCKRSVSRVIDETYHDAPSLTGATWHSPKFIPTPWARPEPGSVGALRMAFACRTLNDT